MKAKLTAIDLAGRRLFVTLAEAEDSGCPVSMERLLFACRKLRFSRLIIITELPEERLSSSIAATAGSITIERAHPNGTLRLPGDRVLQACSKEGNLPGYVFTLFTTDIAKLTEDVAKSTLFIGIILDLDRKYINNLRTSLYELAANTEEHARFPTCDPEVRIELLYSAGRIEVAYMDNATEFETTKKGDLDIGAMIRRRRRRGYGLYILQKLAEDLRYERRRQWNVTSFVLRDPSRSYSKTRR